MRIIKWINAVLLLAGIAGGTLAQGNALPDTHNRAFHLIEQVEIAQDPMGQGTYEVLVKGTYPDGCNVPVVVNTEKVGDVLFIDLYHDVPANQPCPKMLIRFEERLDIVPALAVGGEWENVRVLVVNGKLYGVNRALPEPNARVTSASSVFLSDLWMRGELPYEGYSVTYTDSDTLDLTFTGILGDSCAVPVLRATTHPRNPSILQGEAYVAIPLDTACAQVLTPFQLTVSSPLHETVIVNGATVPFGLSLGKGQHDFFEQAMPLTNATVEWDGDSGSVTITVSGIVDGCENPIQILPSVPVDNLYTVKVVRVMPFNAACTMIAREFTQSLTFAPIITSESPLMFTIGDNQTIMLDLQR